MAVRPRTAEPPVKSIIPAPAAPSAPSAPASRCLIVTDVLDAGGLDEFAAFLARRLPQQGLTTSVAVTGQQGGRLSRALRSDGIEVREAPDAVALRDAVHAFDPLVISAHAPPRWALEIARESDVPVVETLHGLPTPIGTNWLDEPVRCELVSSFVAVSEMVKRQYLRGNPGFPHERIVVVPNGINDEYRPVVDRDQARNWMGLDGEFLFVSLGRLTLQKNSYGLVAAFARLAADFPEIHLLMAGKVEEPLYARHVLGQRASLPAGIAERIHIRDNTSFVSAVLAAADAYVMDSFFEGWSLASMEALAAGLPVVISDVGGAREQVGSDGSRGFVVPNPAGDPETVGWDAAGRVRFGHQPNQDELVSRMADLVRDRERRSDVRLQLAEESRRRFNPEACVVSHASVLRSAARANVH